MPEPVKGRGASPNECAGCGHIRSHHPGLEAQLQRPCMWRGCGCPWFVQKIDLSPKEANLCTLCGRGTEQPTICLVCQELARHV